MWRPKLSGTAAAVRQTSITDIILFDQPINVADTSIYSVIYLRDISE